MEKISKNVLCPVVLDVLHEWHRAIEISRLIDKYLPADGVGTEREQIRMELHNDIAMLVKNLTIPPIMESVCEHDYVYKILYDHTAADVCTKCGNIKKQTVC